MERREPAEKATQGAGRSGVVARFGPRDAVAVALALITYAAVGGGLFDAVYAPVLTVGLALGLVAGLAAGSPVSAALAAGGCGLIGAIVAAPEGASGALSVAVIAAVAAASGLGVRIVLDSGVLRTSIVVALGMLLVVGNLWLTTSVWGPSPGTIEGMSTFQFLAAPPPDGIEQNDQQYYLSVYYRMKSGAPYYRAIREAYHANAAWGYDPPSVMAVREPALFELWAATPGDGRSIVWLLAVLGTAAAFAALFLAGPAAGPAAGLTAAAAVSAYFAHFTTLPVVTWSEPWAGALALLAAAALVASSGEDGRRRTALLWGAAMAAALAVAVRELMLFVPAAGVASAFLAGRDRRREALAAWGASLAVSLAALGLHVWAASAIVTPRDQGMSTWVGRGGLDAMTAAMTTGARFFAGPSFVPVVLGLLGAVAAVAAFRGRDRAFLAACSLLPLGLFLVVWNGAIDVATGRAVNYWGGIVMPLLLALAPVAAGLLDPAERLRWRRGAASMGSHAA